MAINQNDIIYFILTDRFYGVENSNVSDINKLKNTTYHGGNFDGIIEKIPYLKKLGITALWITPVYLQVPPVDEPGKEETMNYGYHGYWPLDFNKVDPHLYIDGKRYPEGSKKHVKDLADKLHENGIKLILDMVVNHTGYNHPGTTDADNNPTPIKPAWFNKKGLSCADDVIEGELSCLPDMDLDNPDVIYYHINTILSWIEETGVDAIRMDTVRHVEKAFWNYYKTMIKGKYTDVSLIGEVLVFDTKSISEYQKHFAFDSLFDFPLQKAICDTFIYDGSLVGLVSPFNKGFGILENDNVYTNQNKLVTLLDNHDLSARFASWSNQKHGSGFKTQASVNTIKLALSFMFTVRGIPQLYYGTEIGMEGFSDPDNRKDFEWDKFDENYTLKDEYAFEKDIFEHTCKLIKIRKENEALYCGNFVCIYVDTFVMVYLRYFKENIILVAINNGNIEMPKPLEICVNNNSSLPTRINEKTTNGNFTCLISNKKIRANNGIISVQLKGKGCIILKNES